MNAFLLKVFAAITSIVAITPSLPGMGSGLLTLENRTEKRYVVSPFSPVDIFIKFTVWSSGSIRSPFTFIELAT